MGFMSCHIIPLAINSLGEADTQTHRHMLHKQNQYLETKQMPDLISCTLWGKEKFNIHR